MQADDGTVLRGHAHDPEDLRVIEHQAVRIGHEEFEGGHTLALDQGLHVSERLVADPVEDQVCTDVHAGRHSPASPFVQGGQGRRCTLVAEVDDGGGAAECGGSGARCEGVDGARCPELPIQVGVGVDPARKDEEAGRIVGPRSPAPPPGPCRWSGSCHPHTGCRPHSPDAVITRPFLIKIGFIDHSSAAGDGPSWTFAQRRCERSAFRVRRSSTRRSRSDGVSRALSSVTLMARLAVAGAMVGSDTL